MADDYEPVCPDCKTNRHVLLLFADGAYVCQQCGRTVQRYVVSEGSEWRTFKSDSGNNRGGDPNRVGGPERDGEVLSLTVGQTHGTRLGNMRQVADKATLRQRKLNAAFNDIRHMGDKLNLKTVHTDVVKEIYKNIENIKYPKEGEEKPSVKRDFSGLRSEVVIAACFYCAAKILDVPRSIKDVQREAGNVTMRELRNAYNRIKKHKRQLLGKLRRKKEAQSIRASKLVRRYANDLNIKKVVANTAERIADAVTKNGCLEGKKPSTIAGASLLIALEASPSEHIDIKLVEEAFGVTINTLRDRARVIKGNGINAESAAKILEDAAAAEDSKRKR